MATRSLTIVVAVSLFEDLRTRYRGAARSSARRRLPEWFGGPARCPSPDADLTRWSKKLSPFIQSVAYIGNTMELASIPFCVRFPPPSLRTAANRWLARSAPLLSAATPFGFSYMRAVVK